MTMGNRLRTARESLGLSQVELAKLAGIKQPSLSDIETGATKELSGRVLCSLAKHLKKRPEWLMHGDTREKLVPVSPEEAQLLVSFQQADENIKRIVMVALNLPPPQASLSVIPKLK